MDVCLKRTWVAQERGSRGWPEHLGPWSWATYFRTSPPLPHRGPRGVAGLALLQTQKSRAGRKTKVPLLAQGPVAALLCPHLPCPGARDCRHRLGQ